MDTLPELSKSGLEWGAEGAFAASVLIPALLASQNPDGGWGFRANLQSRIEPTAWAFLALREYSTEPGAESASQRAIDFIRDAQLPNGSWPVATPSRQPAPGTDHAAAEENGAWVTALGCWALLIAGNSRDPLKRGLEWLCNDRPGESGFWWRLRRTIAGNSNVKQSDSYFGWSWTPGTASWVEPTSHALIALRSAPRDILPATAAERIKLAEAMLYDRMCIGGGWNCGNPMVCGVPGEPLVGPTVWALIALRADSQRSQNQLSLDWLERTFGEMGSPESMTLAHIGLKLNKRDGQNQPALIRKSLENRVQDLSAPDLAWAALALASKITWVPT